VCVQQCTIKSGINSITIGMAEFEIKSVRIPPNAEWLACMPQLFVYWILDLGIECKIFTCGNDDYEVLKLNDFQGPFTSNSKTFKALYSVLKYFPGPGKMDNFFQDFQGSVATLYKTTNRDNETIVT